jgi:putative sterol carrier protein
MGDGAVATVEQCRDALNTLAQRMASNAGGSDFNRTLACRITDLQTAFHARLANGRIEDLSDGDNPAAKIKLILSSDDLIALVNGQLNAGSAWASGRIKIEAGMMDLLKLRKIL